MSDGTSDKMYQFDTNLGQVWEVHLICLALHLSMYLPLILELHSLFFTFSLAVELPDSVVGMPQGGNSASTSAGSCLFLWTGWSEMAWN